MVLVYSCLANAVCGVLHVGRWLCFTGYGFVCIGPLCIVPCSSFIGSCFLGLVYSVLSLAPCYDCRVSCGLLIVSGGLVCCLMAVVCGMFVVVRCCWLFVVCCLVCVACCSHV